jgi:chitin synthase
MGRPLEQYFKGDTTLAGLLGRRGIEHMSLLKKNMYLAEDRIISFEIVMKAGCKWHLGYVKAARAENDDHGDMADFIVQRRRWLNGSFATTVYSVLHFHRVYQTGHSLPRMALLHVQFIYNIVNFLLSWFSLAGFLLTLFIVNEVSGSPPADTQVSGFPFGKATPIFNAVLQVIYVCTIVVQFILALGTRPRAAWLSYLVSFLIFGIIQVYFIMNVIYLFKRVADVRFKNMNQGAKNFEYINVYYSDIGDITVIVSGVAVFGVYIAAGFLHLDPWHLFTSYAQYLFIVSSYTNILSVYAFSNFNDHSWGNKGARPEPSIKASAISKATIDQEAVVEEPVVPQKDIDSEFEAIAKRALKPYVPPQIKIKRTLDDDAKIFRIRLIGAYIFSNFFLCIFILNDSFKQLHWLGDSYWHKIWFFRIWLWANAACLHFRFLGSLVDLGKKCLCCLFLRR